MFTDKIYLVSSTSWHSKNAFTASQQYYSLPHYTEICSVIIMQQQVHWSKFACTVP